MKNLIVESVTRRRDKYLEEYIWDQAYDLG